MIDPSRSSSMQGRRSSPPAKAPAGTRTYKWLAMCLLLLGITWGPLLGLHIHRMSLSAASAGAVIAVFPPTWSSQQLFQNIIESNGAPVGPIRWLPNAWVVQSPESGFVGRLKARGAWGVFSPDLLSADALFNCIRTVASAPADST